MEQKATFVEERAARRELLAWGKELYDQGLVKGSGGNLSIRLDENTVLLTPTGFFLGHMTEDCISKCDLSGNLLEGPPPTKEVPLHLAVYQVRPNVRAVCHTHSIYAVTYASSVEPESEMPIYMPSVSAKVGAITVEPYAHPGSLELGESVRQGIAASNAVLLANHGVVAVGKSMEAAVSVANEVEMNARIHLLSHGAARPIPVEAVRHLHQKSSL